ncbi:MAG: glucose dehydrogenase [Planctomyces sp.]|nr:glucose dehydrogenase [Planctomyces sp.]
MLLGRTFSAMLSASLMYGTFAASSPAQDPYKPAIGEKSEEAELAKSRFKFPAGIKVQLAASEPEIANPVAFCFDEEGNLFVAETFRQSKGIEDNRSHMNWLLDDLAAQTVADRIAYMRKHIPDADQRYTKEHDRIRKLQDLDGDGVYETATVFADGFNAIEDGTGAGLLAWNGRVYYTCIPKLWMLVDNNGDGVADEREVLSDGYGVRFAFRGHDSHGLAIGPDGRLYFSIGDRGYNIDTRAGKLVNPDRGAVFRCEPDGSQLEVFATGLRNPQELAFDNRGRLFTGDNNSDGGDKARWTYVMRQSDTGWRMNYQYLNDRGPWNREKLWHPAHEGQAAYIVPPILNFADGPSGLTHNPGTGLPAKYDDWFFLADFRGTAAISGVRALVNKPKGAGFEIASSEMFIWGILATDVDFGYDSSIYVSDWVNGWEGLGKGRIYRFTDGENPAGQEVAKLFREGFAKRTVAELVTLLSHADYRVRQRAQFALVSQQATAVLSEQTARGATMFARLHAIWGLGQLARQKIDVGPLLMPLLADPAAEIREATAVVVGDIRYQPAAPVLAGMLRDVDAHVQAQAAIALGQLGGHQEGAALVDALAANNNIDPFLRHALVVGLMGTNDLAWIAKQLKHVSPAVRLGTVVALRRLESQELGLALKDADPLVVLEAARAVHDLRQTENLGTLSALPVTKLTNDALARRILSANYRLGKLENARKVAEVAANASLEETLRIEAINELMAWNEPAVLDRVLGDLRPLANREVPVGDVIRPLLSSMLASPSKVRDAATKLAAKYGVKEVQPILRETALSLARDGNERLSALEALQALKDPELASVAGKLLMDKDPAVRAGAAASLVKVDRPKALEYLKGLTIKSPAIEVQRGINTLAAMQDDSSREALDGWLSRLGDRSAPPEAWLELLEIAKEKKSDAAKKAVVAFDGGRDAEDPLGKHRELVAGGDVDRGLDIFFNRSEVSCQRCHRVGSQGGEVGPILTKIGAEKTPEYLLEAIVDPNRVIAKGFETAILGMEDGRVLVGIIKSEADGKLVLQPAEGNPITVNVAEIEERSVGKSGMPEDLAGKISRRELRDLVAYLASLKSDQNHSSHGASAVHGESYK